MRVDRRPQVIAIMGPTASGKTAFALETAARYGGEIISVDSALIYRGLDIGTAKPTAAMTAQIPHHLIDIRDPWESYSAAEYSEDARIALDAIVGRKKLPILVGGTGLYFRALLQGLSDMPEADSQIRAAISLEAKHRGWPALHSDLMRIDPDAGVSINPNDSQRIQRALEVFRLTGRTISQWRRQAALRKLPYRVLKLVLAPYERTELHLRIEHRFDDMLNAGFLKEIESLREHPMIEAAAQPLDLPALRAVGYRQGWMYLDGSYDSSTEFRNRAIFATRQLAKRQITWLRTELDACWFDPDYDSCPLHTTITAFLEA